MKLWWFVLCLFCPLLLIPPACTGTYTFVSGNKGTGSYTLTVDVVAKSLEIPWAIDFAPDGRFFITERPGRVRIIKDGQLQADPWINIETSAATTIFGESGLLGLAIDPNFAANRYVYVAYSYNTGNGGLGNRLVRLKENPATGKGISDKILLDGARGAANHNGGRVKFGPDGKIYWTMGESQDRPLAQDLASFNGKILRLNLDGTVPVDNPFPESAVYTLGHRNPQGLAWQPGTARLYETEHGPSGEKGVGQDEINYIEPGKNYGWPEISGAETKAGMVSPIIQSGTGETWAPSGATFVKGGPWNGSMLFVGLRGQTLYRLTLDANDPRKVLGLEKLLTGKYGRLRDVAQAPDGSIYVLTSNRDGRGLPMADDDRLLKLTVK
jgi:aldose sugar dehydrogenase